MQFRLLLITILLLLVSILGACRDALPSVPEVPELPVEMPDINLPDIPGIPQSLEEIPDLLNQLELPDISGVANLPELDALPGLNVPEGALAFRGPTEHGIEIGERIPGTDIELVGINNSEAEFSIAGFRSVKVQGDSLDYDGNWPDINGVTYNLRLRVYRVGDSSVRAAGVHQIIINNADPVVQPIASNVPTMSFPFTVSAGVGEMLAGSTFGYAGDNERGAEITGLGDGEFPYRKMGDSIRWAGLLRGDIPGEYNLRVLYYDASSVRVGGVVHLALPGL